MHRSRRVAIAATLALAGLAAGTVTGSAGAAPHTGVTAHIRHRTLIINGTDAGERIVLRVPANKPGYLRVYVNTGPWDLQITRSKFDRIIVNARGGDDIVRIDETAGVAIPFTTTTPTSLRGDNGNDKLYGGSGAEQFLAGNGWDVVDGNQGNDVAWLGWGNDQFIWDPGDGSDRIEGGPNYDLMTFNGSDGDEVFQSIDNHGRLRFTRSLGNIVMDTNDLERVNLNTLGGRDDVLVNDLRATDVKLQYVDAGAALGAAGGDGALDTVKVVGSPLADHINLSGAAGVVNVAGLVPAVKIVDADLTDRLTIASVGGNDVVDASALNADTMLLEIQSGDGNDTVLGGRGADTVKAGNGWDVVDGNQGNDVAWLGWGNDEFIWDPGDGSDSIEGGAHLDLMTFNGSSGAEIFDASANGARLRFFRNLGNIVMDTNDLDRVDLNALAGTDEFTMNDLSATDVRAIKVDLAAVLGGTTGDGELDKVTANGTDGHDNLTVSGNHGSVRLAGLASRLDLTNADWNDKLIVNGLGGTDTLDAGGLAPDTIDLQFVD